ncbi:thioredoxin H-type 1-like [Solanum dulcamara]|uniref:thioredoxin H-type 1-like n=1 Tax=Solanum dulcamara TaxID=45834 RepID=UPI002485CB58|nr:thioredoxin H-type 1-like [Solanum dulcamara]
MAATSSEEGQLISCHKVEEWKEHLQKGVETQKLVVVDFTASWCGPCRFIAPILADIAKKMPHVIFLKVDVDELKTVAEEWNVEAMPTFVFIKEGKEVSRVVGANKDGLLHAIQEHGAAPATVIA